MKKHTPDNIGEVTFTTNNSALILWRTRAVNYLFVNYLNQCYNLRFWRDEDLSLSQFIPALSSLPPCPMWYYFDTSSQVFYVLIDINGCQRQLGGSLVYYDKLLFLYGRDCWDKMHQIYSEFTLRIPPSDPLDLLALHCREKLQNARNTVEKVDYYDARHVPVSGDKMITDPSSDDYDTSLLAGVRHPFPKDMCRKMAAFNDLLLDILTAIEINLQSMEV